MIDRFLKLFDSSIQTEESNTSLQKSIHQLIESEDQNEILKLSCLAGLLAKVAYADLKISPEETEMMITVLTEEMQLDRKVATNVVELASEEMERLAGVGSEKYGHLLGDLCSTDERYQILLALFQVAAAEGGVSNLESETIRSISKGLLLEHRHFVSARASVSEKLNLLSKK